MQLRWQKGKLLLCRLLCLDQVWTLLFWVHTIYNHPFGEFLMVKIIKLHFISIHIHKNNIRVKIIPIWCLGTFRCDLGFSWSLAKTDDAICSPGCQINPVYGTIHPPLQVCFLAFNSLFSWLYILSTTNTLWEWTAIKQSTPFVNVQILGSRKINDIKSVSRQWKLFQKLL